MRRAVIGLVLLLTYIIETTVLHHLQIGGIVPNVMVAVVVSFGLLRGQKEGLIIGIMGGLIYDITFGMTAGSKVVAYAAVGYLCGKLNKDIYRENFIIPFICTVISAFAVNLFPMLRLTMLGKINFVFYFQNIIIPELIYTIMLSLIVYQVTYSINERMEIREKKTRNIF